MRRVLMIAAVIALFAACKKDGKFADGTPPVGNTAKPADTAATTPTDHAADQTEADSVANPVPNQPPALGTPPATGGARPPAVTDAHVALADKLLAAMESLGESVAAAGEDCKAAAVALQRSAEAVKPLAEEVQKVKASITSDTAAEEWFRATYGPKMMGAMGPLIGVAQACAQDKDFQAAMMSMQSSMGGKKKGP